MIELEFYYLYEAGFVRISPQCGTNFKQTSRHFFKSTTVRPYGEYGGRVRTDA